MEKKINLEQILDFNLSLSSINPPSKHFYLCAMKDACKRILELAAENAALNIPTNEWQCRWIEKDSITNTINQIE